MNQLWVVANVYEDKADVTLHQTFQGAKDMAIKVIGFFLDSDEWDDTEDNIDVFKEELATWAENEDHHSIAYCDNRHVFVTREPVLL